MRPTQAAARPARVIKTNGPSFHGLTQDSLGLGPTDVLGSGCIWIGSMLTRTKWTDPIIIHISIDQRFLGLDLNWLLSLSLSALNITKIEMREDDSAFISDLQEKGYVFLFMCMHFYCSLIILAVKFYLLEYIVWR